MEKKEPSIFTRLFSTSLFLPIFEIYLNSECTIGCKVTTNSSILWFLDYHSVIWIFYEEAIKYQFTMLMEFMQWKYVKKSLNRSVLHISIELSYKCNPHLNIAISLQYYKSQCYHPTPLWSTVQLEKATIYLHFFSNRLFLHSQQRYYISKMIACNIFGGK